MHHDAIETLILQLIQSSCRRWTRPDLQRRVIRRHGLTPIQVKAAIASLLNQNEIAYTNHFGSTFLELSYNKPVRITEFIVIKPPSCSYDSGPGEVVIDLEPGVSFGNGRHPTTRLCLRGLDFLFKRGNIVKANKATDVLDIGTGSGILVAAAVKLGCTTGLGLDPDPCAVAEARANVLLNGLETRIHITAMPVEDIRSKFFLIIANLRLPTIERLFHQLLDRTVLGGIMLLSGIKAEEMYLFQKIKQNDGRVEAIWQATELGWGAMAFKKRPASV